MQDIATAYRVAVHTSNDWFLESINRLVHLEGWQYTGIKIGIFHTFFSATDTKKFIAGACEYNNPRAGFAANRIDAITQFMTHLCREHIAIMRAIKSNPSYWTVLAVQDCFKSH